MFSENAFNWSKFQEPPWHSFDKLLIFFWITLVDIFGFKFDFSLHPRKLWFSRYIKEIFYVNTYSKGNKSWNKRKEKRNTFSFVSDVDVEKSIRSVSTELELYIFLNLNSYHISTCKVVSFNRFTKKYLFIKLALITTTNLTFFSSRNNHESNIFY